jgi:small GTP-binding protein
MNIKRQHSFFSILKFTHRSISSRSCGIVGYPNIGKSTLFNALTKTQQAQASNYPFCTIDPNVAKVAVYDSQVKALIKAANPEKVSPCQIEIWDIAGLIKGASEGAGLGNKFLQNIRQVNSIIHLVRCFEDTNVIYSEGDVNNLDPITEMEDVQTELILSDLEICAKKVTKKGLTPIED